MNNTSPLVESLLSGDRIGVGGILCNDPNGLCLVSKGNMVTADHSSSNNNNNNNGGGGGNVNCSNDDKSGVFTSLVRLSYQLQELQQQHPSLNNNNESTPHNASSPLITIETDTSAILVKEYDGHAVAMRVPRTGPQNEKS